MVEKEASMTIENLTEMLRAIDAKTKGYMARSIHMYEANTIDTAITPILRVLGWDIEDLDQVRREYRHHAKDNPVDFSLMHDGAPVLFVEAKGLGENLNDRKWITQTHAYAHACGVSWAVLTNGIEWRVYKVSMQGQAEDKLLLQVRIEEADAAQHLYALARDHLVPQCLLDVLWKRKEVDSTMRSIFAGMADNTAILRAFARSSNGRLSVDDVRYALLRAKPRADWEDPLLPLARDVEPVEAPRKLGRPKGSANARRVAVAAQEAPAQNASANPETNTPAQDPEPCEPPVVSACVPTLESLIQSGRLPVGERLHAPGCEDSACLVVDGKFCEFGGAVVTYTSWGKKVTGSASFDPVRDALLESGLPVSSLAAGVAAA